MCNITNLENWEVVGVGERLVLTFPTEELEVLKRGFQ